MAVDTDTRTARWQPAGDAPRCWSEIVGGVFGVDPAFDRMAGEVDLLLLNADGLSTGNAQLLGDQVDPGHHLRHRMLHLDAGVHLHEIEPTAAVEQELDSASALVVDAAGCGHGRFTHATA